MYSCSKITLTKRNVSINQKLHVTVSQPAVVNAVNCQCQLLSALFRRVRFIQLLCDLRVLLQFYFYC